MKRSPSGLSLAALAFSVLVGAQAAPPVGADDASRQAMADAMARMMEAMGFLGSAAGGSPSGGAMPGMGWPPSGGGPSWGGAGQDMAQDWVGRFFPGMTPGMPQMPWQATPLQGVWEGAGGGLLIVQGSYFRLYAQDWTFADGMLQTAGARVRMARQDGFDQTFEYALDQGRLALRDPSGQLYLYRLIVLGPGGG